MPDACEPRTPITPTRAGRARAPPRRSGDTNLPKNSSNPCTVGRQVLVPVAQMVLAELAYGITVSFEGRGDRRVFGSETGLRRRADPPLSCRCGPVLPAVEHRAPRRAGLLPVVVGEPGTSSAVRSMLGVR